MYFGPETGAPVGDGRGGCGNGPPIGNRRRRPNSRRSRRRERAWRTESGGASLVEATRFVSPFPALLPIKTGVIITMQPTIAGTFRALHSGANALILPNVWDAATAALFAAAGARAIATTSAGLAWACGFPDEMPCRAHFALGAASDFAASGTLPTSADIEGGFSDDPAAVAGLVVELCGLGIAGINLEDGTGAPDLLAAKIAAIKSCRADAGRRGVRQRADGRVLARIRNRGRRGARDDRASAALRRCRRRRHIRSGLGTTRGDPTGCRRRWASVESDGGARSPPAAELYAYGVRRVSAGSSMAEMAYGTAATPLRRSSEPVRSTRSSPDRPSIIVKPTPC